MQPGPLNPRADYAAWEAAAKQSLTSRGGTWDAAVESEAKTAYVTGIGPTIFATQMLNRPPVPAVTPLSQAVQQAPQAPPDAPFVANPISLNAGLKFGYYFVLVSSFVLIGIVYFGSSFSDLTRRFVAPVCILAALLVPASAISASIYSAKRPDQAARAVGRGYRRNEAGSQTRRA